VVRVAAVEPVTPPEPMESKPQESGVKQPTAADVSYDIMLVLMGTRPSTEYWGSFRKKDCPGLEPYAYYKPLWRPRGGKSYTLGTVIEMASMPLEHINVLPNLLLR